jgi:hypothetical protein
LKTRFYKYYFIGVEKPVIMEAETKNDADAMLVELQKRSKTNIDFSKLIDTRVETPIVGISTKKRKGLDMVWVGKEYSNDGWITQEEYNQIVKQNNNDRK